MISYISGTVKFKGGNFAVILVGGIGYRVFVSAETLMKIPKLDESVSLWTHHHVKEDRAELYGFFNYSELEFFEKLIQISGIGPKSGLAVLAVGSLDNLKRAIASGEVSYLKKVSGIGQRLAEKIVLELKDKLGPGLERSEMFKDEEDALEALRTLGYTVKECRDALKNVPRGTIGVDKIIKEALKNVSKK